MAWRAAGGGGSRNGAALAAGLLSSARLKLRLGLRAAETEDGAEAYVEQKGLRRV